MFSRIVTIAAAAVLAGASSVHAAQSAEGCRAAKIKAAASASVSKLKCHAAAAKKGKPVEPDCLTKADTKFGVTFTRIESRGSCAPSGDQASYLAEVDDFVAAVVAGDLCSPKLKAAGAEAKGLLKCYSRAIKSGDTADNDCLAKAEERLAQAFAKADAKGCAPTGGVDTAQGQVDLFVANLVGFPPSATSITIYSAGAQTTGVLGNRSTTSAACTAAASSQSLTCANVVALLSYTGDSVNGFPGTYALPTGVPIVAGNPSQTIANTWADFLDGSWSTCLGNSCSPAGPTGASLFTFESSWTGTEADGTKSTSNCNDWSSTVGGGQSISADCYGVSDSFSCEAGKTLAADNNNCGTPGKHLLCLCY